MQAYVKLVIDNQFSLLQIKCPVCNNLYEYNESLKSSAAPIILKFKEKLALLPKRVNKKNWIKVYKEGVLDTIACGSDNHTAIFLKEYFNDMIKQTSKT